MSEEKNLNILKKMALVAAEEAVSFIVKDARNEHFNFNYASEKAIKEAVYPALRKHGVVFQLSQGIPVMFEGNMVVPCEYHFHDKDSGECLSGTFNGEGSDNQAKGVYIATTGAIKYLMTSMFGIVTGDDPDHDKQNTEKTTSQTIKQSSPPASNQPSGSSGKKPEFTMKSKFGSFDKPSKCNHCGRNHIMEGEDICKDPTTGKYGAVECY